MKNNNGKDVIDMEEKLFLMKKENVSTSRKKCIKNQCGNGTILTKLVSPKSKLRWTLRKEKKN